MPIAVGAILMVLNIAGEEWKKLPASKKARIRKAVEEKDFEKARKIYAGNPYSALSIKETETHIHVRVKSPNVFHEGSFRVVHLGNRIKATIGCPKTARFEDGKCQDGTKIQKLMFEKPDWTKEKSEDWVKTHPTIKVRRKS